MLTRRCFLAAAASAPLLAAARPAGVLIDTHIHLFAADRRRFPFHKNAPYEPGAQTVEDYARFVAETKLDHAVIVHPEPYQDDHSYLEYCFENEPSSGFFKGTCLFDTLDPATPGRMAELARRHPGRIVAMRVHEMGERVAPYETSGSIKNRDPGADGMKKCWRAAADLGMAIQVHMKPFFAPPLEKLVAEFPDLPVVIDHLARSGMGTEADWRDVLRLADRPKVYMKFSGINYSSKQDPPYADAKPRVKQAYEAFGAERMLWGGLGFSAAQLEDRAKTLDFLFDYAPESDRAQVRGLTAKKLFGF